jgi:hypothetical protein
MSVAAFGALYLYCFWIGAIMHACVRLALGGILSSYCTDLKLGIGLSERSQSVEHVLLFLPIQEHTSQIHGREDAGIAQEPGDLPLSAAAAPQHVSQRTCHYSDSSQGRGDNAPARDTGAPTGNHRSSETSSEEASPHDAAAGVPDVAGQPSLDHEKERRLEQGERQIDTLAARLEEKNQEMRVVLRTVDHLISENRALKTAGQEREAAGPHHRTTAFTSSAEIVRVAI